MKFEIDFFGVVDSQKKLILKAHFEKEFNKTNGKSTISELISGKSK